MLKAVLLRNVKSTLSESVELSIDNIPIKEVSATKSLGILINKNLLWDIEIEIRLTLASVP